MLGLIRKSGDKVPRQAPMLGYALLSEYAILPEYAHLPFEWGKIG